VCYLCQRKKKESEEWNNMHADRIETKREREQYDGNVPRNEE
jgi:predicted Fe-S protein YdhL (DUF1289 family)